MLRNNFSARYFNSFLQIINQKETFVSNIDHLLAFDFSYVFQSLYEELISLEKESWKLFEIWNINGLQGTNNPINECYICFLYILGISWNKS